MNTRKTNKKKIIDELTKGKQPKRNITFAFPEELILRFKKECEKHDLKMNQVIEKLIENFVEEEK